MTTPLGLILKHVDKSGDVFDDYLGRAARVEDQMLEDAEDALDAHLARSRIDGMSSGAERVVSGPELDRRLATLMDE